MTSKDYLLSIKNIVSVYENLGVDITTFLSIYLNDHPDAYNAFLKLYKWDNCNYKRKDLKRIKFFYEKLSSVLLDDYKYYVEFNIIPLQRKFKSLEYENTFYQKRRDYLFALLLMSEGFLNDDLKNDNISSYEDGLFALDNNLLFTVNRKQEDKECNVQIVLPNMILVNYDSYNYACKKELKK